ncbi:hypothetical protein, partial [Nocardia cyriacigeorgica]|uniref:hypothetical protein n=1 Tax=Nocardia cyriacigeorgica TaxID=135487 RepID=UPI001C499F0B
FRPSATGMDEERLIRGLHPYIAERMQLKRLRKFDLTRLPSCSRSAARSRTCVKAMSRSSDGFSFATHRNRYTSSSE